METREVALIGRMIAGMTHEIKNVLAIIKESSGLLQDILRLKKGKAVPKAEQIEKVASRIKAQVARGNEQLASLNWLAHSMSDRSSSVGVNELSSGVVNLMQRFARLKQVELELQPTDRRCDDRHGRRAPVVRARHLHRILPEQGVAEGAGRASTRRDREEKRF